MERISRYLHKTMLWGCLLCLIAFLSMSNTSDAGQKSRIYSKTTIHQSDLSTVRSREVISSTMTFEQIAIEEAASGTSSSHLYSPSQILRLTGSARKVHVSVGTSWQNLKRPPKYLGRMSIVAEHYDASNHKLVVIWAS